MESLVKKEDDYSPFMSVEQPAWAPELNEEEDENEEEEGIDTKFDACNQRIKSNYSTCEKRADELLLNTAKHHIS